MRGSFRCAQGQDIAPDAYLTKGRALGNQLISLCSEAPDLIIHVRVLQRLPTPLHGCLSRVLALAHLLHHVPVDGAALHLQPASAQVVRICGLF